MEPSRVIFWNIDYAWIMYSLATIVIIALGYSLYRHLRRWRVGRPAGRSGNLPWRCIEFLRYIVMDLVLHAIFFGATHHDRRPREWYAGLMHFFIFAGFAVFLLGAFLDALSHYTVHFLTGNTYLAYSVITDGFGILAIIGVGMALYRRYILKPDRLDSRADDLVVLMLVLVTILTGFVVEGLRIAAAELPIHPEWSLWSPGGYILALAFRNASASTLQGWHIGLWWFHSLLALGSIAYMAFYNSRLLHIFWDPVNVFFRNLGPKGALAPLDFENEEFFGVSKLEDFTWKQLLDLDSCTRCGRCRDACPANASGKSLNPKQLIQDLKQHLYEVYPGNVSSGPADNRRELLGGVITDEVIWDCTTCRACVQACPVAVEHVDSIIDVRRNLVMEQARFPDAAREALKFLGTRGHPFRGTTATRTDWCDGLDIPLISDTPDAELLLWAGCSVALDERNMRIARSLARILKAAGIRFAILGDEETCCGDPARRMGDEYLFQTICQQNIETLNSAGIRSILTACPHCFNSLKYEYPQFGGRFTVEHHATYIARLLSSGRISLPRGTDVITYHDSCYLGRYNNIYNEPRSVVDAVTASRVELPRRRSASFCCGGGGGHLWMEEESEQRVSHRRMDEILASGASCVATACPYCLTMLDDARKEKGAEETCAVMDLAELVAAALP